MFDGVLGSASDGGNLGVREVVDVEEDEFLLVVGELVDEAVEFLDERVGGLAGEGVAEAVVDRDDVGAVGALLASQLHARSVECHAIDPSGGVAVVPELRPAAPEVADNLLIEVVDVAGLAVGEGEADTVEDAPRTAKHLLKLDMSSILMRHHCGLWSVVCDLWSVICEL